jgi:hypothetical protein
MRNLLPMEQEVATVCVTKPSKELATIPGLPMPAYKLNSGREPNETDA